MNTTTVWMDFRTALESIPAHVRACYVLHDMFEVGRDDVAEMLGVSPDACFAHVELARKTMLLSIGHHSQGTFHQDS